MKKEQNARCAKRISSCKEETYLAKIFSILKARSRIIFHDGKTHYNDTELRLISEIVSAMYEGRRLISTQLADLLGVTRSAISQIVNRLEEQGVVQRVADEVDRKIAYIQLADGVMDSYSKDLEACFAFLHEAVGRFGEERFFRMCDDFEKFIDLAKEICEQIPKK